MSRQPTVTFGRPQEIQGSQLRVGGGEQRQTFTTVRETRYPAETSSYISNIQHSTVSVRDNTHYQNTDNLYRPLKETIEHPEIVRQHEGFTPEAVKTSYVSREYRRLNTKDFQDIVHLFTLRNATPTSPTPSSWPPTTLRRSGARSSWP
jgi:hypothetical protein